jgi:hypothetical protein
LHILLAGKCNRKKSFPCFVISGRKKLQNTGLSG